jgi:hypothetical protein
MVNELWKDNELGDMGMANTRRYINVLSLMDNIGGKDGE